jgi:DNA polymerase III subunit delta
MTDKPTPTFYLLYGSDDLGLEEALKKLRAKLGIDANDLNSSEFDGDQARVAEVLNAVCSFPFLSDRRVVLVRGLLEHLTRKGAGEGDKKDVERLLDEITKLPASARLILVESSLRADSKVVKLANDLPTAQVQHFSAPDDSTDWILKRARTEYQADIELNAAGALASVCGSDLRRADNELLKLVCYVDGTRAITEKDVALLTPYQAEANVFEMVEAVAAGRGRAALTLLNTAMEQDTSDPGFGIFALITQQFRRLLLVREYLDTGGSGKQEDVAKAIGLPPRQAFLARKLTGQASKFKLAELERIYRRLQKYDQDMKIGRIKPRLALDLFITSVAGK